MGLLILFYPFEDPSLILLIAFEQISGNMATEHVNGNGTEEPMDTTSCSYPFRKFSLLDVGLPQKVAEKLDEIYVAGKNLILAKLHYEIFLLDFWLLN